jgi:hypothetical protein
MYAVHRPVLIIIVMGIFGAAEYASARTLIVEWTFEGNTVPSELSDSQLGPGMFASAGEGSGTGFHSNANTDWTAPIGNGSAHSFSANTWQQGDHFQFWTLTTGFRDMALAWDQMRNDGGPSNFVIDFSTDGIQYVEIPSSAYTVSINSAPPGLWNTDNLLSEYHYEMDLSSFLPINDQVSIYLRMRTTADAALSTGVSAIDNVRLSGVRIPEPRGILIASVLWFTLVGRVAVHTTGILFMHG